MNDLPEKPLSSEILLVLMGSNPQINGILRVSEHMYVYANAVSKEIFIHTRLNQASDCGLGCLMSAECCCMVLVQLDRSLEAP